MFGKSYVVAKPASRTTYFDGIYTRFTVPDTSIVRRRPNPGYTGICRDMSGRRDMLLGNCLWSIPRRFEGIQDFDQLRGIDTEFAGDEE